ncbi:hypothetical protein [Acrocarpospora catenulata]|uniref:hypothetical protein n=1 Tax=Acrocarpospora catenulata TaxID=2836182 RepID=UPI001BDB1BD2|nr:hypothetical protein [Acrocarpospora catenulata]
MINVTAHPGPRPSAEIRAYLRTQLNNMLRRPGMYGPEVALRLLLDYLSYAEREEDAWAEEHEALHSRGAFNAFGVAGAFSSVIPGRDDNAVASIYAEFARDRGWLDVERTLTGEEYASLRRELATWTAQDRILADVHEAFGPPSVLFGSTNPHFGSTLAYLTERTTEPMVFFHLWNGTSDEPVRRPIFDEPVLLAVRVGRGPFEDSFTFTPEGNRRRPEPPDLYG